MSRFKLRSTQAIVLASVLSAVPAHAFFDKTYVGYSVFAPITTTVNETNVYIDTKDLASAIRSSGAQIAKAIADNSHLHELPLEERERIKNHYDLSHWGSKISVDIDGAGASLLTQKYGRPVFEQIIEDRIKNYKIDTVIAANLSRQNRGAASVTSYAEAEAEFETSAFNRETLMNVIDRVRRGKSFSAKEIDDLPLLRNGDSRKFSVEENRLLAKSLQTSVARAAKKVDFRLVNYTNVDQMMNSILKDSDQFADIMVGMKGSSFDLPPSDLSYCNSTLVKDSVSLRAHAKQLPGKEEKRIGIYVGPVNYPYGEDSSDYASDRAHSWANDYLTFISPTSRAQLKASATYTDFIYTYSDLYYLLPEAEKVISGLRKSCDQRISSAKATNAAANKLWEDIAKTSSAEIAGDSDITQKIEELTKQLRALESQRDQRNRSISGLMTPQHSDAPSAPEPQAVVKGSARADALDDRR